MTMPDSTPVLVAVPLGGLILVTLTVLLVVRCAERGQWSGAVRVVGFLCIYPGFLLVLAGFATLIRDGGGIGVTVLISSGLLVEAVGIRLRAWLRGNIG